MTVTTAHAPTTDGSEAEAPPTADPSAIDGGPALVEEELLVEDVSIDGMCGVY
jgi:mycofactocin precursor